MNIIQHKLGVKVEFPEVQPLPALDWAWHVQQLVEMAGQFCVEPTHKRCHKCGQLHPIDSFKSYVNRHGKPYRRNECGKCRVIINRESRHRVKAKKLLDAQNAIV